MLPCLPGRRGLSQALPHPGHPCQPALSPPSGPLAEPSSEGLRLPGWQDFLWTWGPHETQEGARNPGLCLCLLPEGLRRSELQPLVCPFLWPPESGGSAVPLDPHQARPKASLGRSRGTTGRKDEPPRRPGQGLCPFCGPGCGVPQLWQQRGHGLKWAVQNTRAPGRPGWAGVQEEGSERQSGSTSDKPCGSLHPHRRLN